MAESELHNEYPSLASWAGKVALVTGASSGIGRATAIKLAGIGMKVAVTGRRGGRLEELREKLGRAGAEILPLVGDQAAEGTNRGFFRSIRERWGTLRCARQ